MLLCNQLQRINHLFDSAIQHYTWPRLDTLAIVDAPTIKPKYLIFNPVEQCVLLQNEEERKFNVLSAICVSINWRVSAILFFNKKRTAGAKISSLAGSCGIGEVPEIH